ncbi:ABC-F family ATP-binding cassette domain-containing protein, partial [Candidatus Woesearchaeota archaeon]|nr:ABC-F family ATP-binding cassette domain-containing protein [Candidatus Woesearchaeota archaeon]
MLIIKNLDKSFEDKPILNDANLVINKGEKIALIGSNGTGKTTLLRLILEFDDDFYGNIENTFKTISYMTQDLDLRNQNKLFNEAVLFDNRIIEIYNRLEEVENLMCDDNTVANIETYQKLLDEYERLNKKFIELGGHKLEEKGKKVLTNLGFKESQFNQLVETLSGGEKTKLKLAKALICESDFLILDEPTNHLDIANIVWLETFLKQYKGSLLIISHDKYLLNKVCNHTCLIINEKIQKYKGNYETFYLKLSDLNKNNKKALKKIEQEIERSKKIIKDYKSCFGGLKKKLKNNLYKLHK